MIDNPTSAELALAVTKDLELAAKDIVEATPADNSDALLDVFNWQLSKKHALRMLNMDQLMDRVTDQMLKRFDAKPDQFSNDDLLNYMKTAQSILDSTAKRLQDSPPQPMNIQNNTVINVELADTPDRESRARILEAIQATLMAAKENNPEGDVIYDD